MECSQLRKKEKRTGRTHPRCTRHNVDEMVRSSGTRWTVDVKTKTRKMGVRHRCESLSLYARIPKRERDRERKKSIKAGPGSLYKSSLNCPFLSRSRGQTSSKTLKKPLITCLWSRVLNTMNKYGIILSISVVRKCCYQRVVSNQTPARTAAYAGIDNGNTMYGCIVVWLHQYQNMHKCNRESSPNHCH